MPAFDPIEFARRNEDHVFVREIEIFLTSIVTQLKGGEVMSAFDAARSKLEAVTARRERLDIRRNRAKDIED